MIQIEHWLIVSDTNDGACNLVQDTVLWLKNCYKECTNSNKFYIGHTIICVWNFHSILYLGKTWAFIRIEIKKSLKLKYDDIYKKASTIICVRILFLKFYINFWCSVNDSIIPFKNILAVYSSNFPKPFLFFNFS